MDPDEVGWFENHHSAWSIKNLFPEEAKNLHDFIQEEYKDEYKELLEEIKRIIQNNSST